MRLRLASIALLAFASVAAHADTVSFSLLNATQSTTTSGSTLLFSASVSAPASNTGFEDLNNLTVNVLPANGFSISTDPFLNTYPLSLAPGDSFSGLLFTLTVPTGALANSYQGTAVLFGGPSNLQLGSQGFTVNVTPAVAVTPEPSSFFLLGTGVLALGTTFRRRFTGFSS